MSYHILSIDAYTCSLSCSKGQLICVDEENGERQLPLEDIASIVISSFKASITSNLLIEAAKQGIGMILCDAYKPACIVLPVDRASDTEFLRKIAVLPAQFKKRLWDKTLNAKCYNQYALATEWIPQHEALPHFKALVSGKSVSRESECARLFWKIFSGTHPSIHDFKRARYEGGANHLLNYAYAVLLSCILQKLLAIGIDPTFGIFHSPHEHATPLAYDLMEPFRPCFDANVSRWIKSHVTDDSSCLDEVSLEYRRHIVATLSAQVQYLGQSMDLKYAIEQVCRSFRQAITCGEIAPYEPWKISTIKWAGF